MLGMHSRLKPSSTRSTAAQSRRDPNDVTYKNYCSNITSIALTSNVSNCHDCCICCHYCLHCYWSLPFYCPKLPVMSCRPSNVYPNGGHDCDFVVSPPENLLCPICHLVLNDPHLTDCCGHHFCHSCISKSLQICQVCPLCQREFKIFPAKNVTREVNALQVRCPHKSWGCEWQGEFGRLGKHIPVCDCVPVLCRLGCRQEVPHRLQEKHENLLCSFRSYECHYCGNYAGTYQDVSEKHWPRCEFYPVPCPNDCPRGSVPRNRLMKHLKNECKEQRLAELKLQNARISEELQGKGGRIMELEQQLASQRTTIEQLETELKEKRVTVEQLERQMEEKDTKLSSQREGRPSMASTWSDIPTHNTSVDIDEAEKSNSLYPRKVNLLQNPDIYIKWKQCADLPEVLYDASAVLVDKFVYTGGGTCQIIGGFDNEFTILKYDYTNDTWCSLPKLSRHKFALACYKGQLVVIGGVVPANVSGRWKAQYCDSLLVWDDKAHKWTEPYPPMQETRMQPSAVGYGIHIAVAGGTNTNTLDSVEVFDGNSNRWYRASPLPCKVYCATAALLHNTWYIMGGFGLKKGVCHVSLPSLIAEAVETKGKRMCKWELLPNTEFSYATAAAFGDSLLAIGGSKSIGVTDAIHVYFPGKKMWVPVEESLPYPFGGSVAIVLPTEELLLIGGATDMVRYKHTFQGVLKLS